MRSLFLAFLALVFFQQAAFSAPYYRFWRGYKRDNHVKAVVVEGKKQFVDDPSRPMAWADFERLVNQWLIPATTSCCAESSLVAYLPVLMKQGKKESQIHDEIALIVYRSEEAYKKTREDKSNIEAQVYGPLHADVFAMGNNKSEKIEEREKTSRSLVPVPFKEGVDLSPNEANFFLPEAAYDVLNSDVDWQAGHTEFRISQVELSADSVEPLNRYLRELKARAGELGLQGYTTLVTERYVIEYFNWRDEKAWSDFLKGPLDREFKSFARKALELPVNGHQQIPKADPLQYEVVKFGQAGNIRFTPGVKPSPKAKHPRLE